MDALRGAFPFYSPGGLRRILLISPRIFLLLILCSTLLRDGLVGRRFFTGTSPVFTRFINLSETSSRFRCCERYLSEARIRTSSSVSLWPSRFLSNAFCPWSRHSVSFRFHMSSTRDSVLFTCCPPGPEDRLVLKDTSPSKQSNMAQR